MQLETASSRIGPFHVDFRGPHRSISSDGVPIPHLPQNRPVPAGTLGVVNVESTSPEGAGPDRALLPADEPRPSN